MADTDVDDLIGKAAARRPRRDRGTGGGGVTMSMVGRLAGVSQVTVSRALSDPSKVSPTTLRKIEAAVQQTGFVPNRVAGALASRRSMLISALVPSITNVVYSTMVKAFSDGMRSSGYQVLLSETGFEPESEERLVETHLSRRPDAMLLTGIHHSPRVRRMLLGAGIPVVEVWDMTDTPIDMCVGFSHADAGRAVADFAFDAGYRAAATITAADERAGRRATAFARQFAARGGKMNGAFDLPGPASLAEGRRGLCELWDRQGFAGGVIFCSSDLLAHGAVIEAQKRGLSMPQTVAVIGFGDQDFAAHTEPALTTVSVDRTALGGSAAQALLDNLNGNERMPHVEDLGFSIVRRLSA